MKIGNVILKECGEFTAKVCEITPEIAKKLLELNTHNRKIKAGVVQKYVKEIMAGAWVPTASGIGFNEDGILIDGQHRLMAIVESGITVKLLVVTDLPKLSQEKTDTHTKRSAFDVGHLAGWCPSNGFAQTAVYMARRNNGASGSLSMEEVKETAIAHHDAIVVIEEDTKKRGVRYTSVGTRAALVYAYELYGEKALKFYRGIQSSLHSTADDPSFRLREALERLSMTDGKSGSFQDRAFKKTCYAFNAFLKGKKITSIQSDEDIIKPER